MLWALLCAAPVPAQEPEASPRTAIQVPAANTTSNPAPNSADAPADRPSPVASLMPTGFDGVRLGAARAAVPGLTPLRTERVENVMDGEYELAWCARKDAPAEFEGAALDGVEYAFRDDALAGIVVRIHDETGWRRLLAFYQARFGIDERSAFAYDTIWDRVYREWTEDGRRYCAWITCERQTDNCAVSSLTFDPATGKGELRIGDHL
ncbi:MAG: hypothetical protein AB7D57_05075 [Desulfovibrionaceae bacterium]